MPPNQDECLDGPYISVSAIVTKYTQIKCFVNKQLKKINCFENKELKKIRNKKNIMVTLLGPLAAILNFAQKCKKTAISQELSIVKKFCLHVLCIS